MKSRIILPKSARIDKMLERRKTVLNLNKITGDEAVKWLLNHDKIALGAWLTMYHVALDNAEQEILELKRELKK